MSISIEQPPETMDEDTRAWANRLMANISVRFEEQEEAINELRKRVETLESNP